MLRSFGRREGLRRQGRRRWAKNQREREGMGRRSRVVEAALLSSTLHSRRVATAKRLGERIQFLLLAPSWFVTVCHLLLVAMRSPVGLIHSSLCLDPVESHRGHWGHTSPISSAPRLIYSIQSTPGAIRGFTRDFKCPEPTH